MLFKLGRFDDAIAAWTRALAGDGDSIIRGDIDRRSASARQKLPRTMTRPAAVALLAASDRRPAARPLMKLPSGTGAPAADACTGARRGDRRLPRRLLDQRELDVTRLGRRAPFACAPAGGSRGTSVGPPRSACAIRRAGVHLGRRMATMRRFCSRAMIVCSSTDDRMRCSRRSPASRSTPLT